MLSHIVLVHSTLIREKWIGRQITSREKRRNERFRTVRFFFFFLLYQYPNVTVSVLIASSFELQPPAKYFTTYIIIVVLNKSVLSRTIIFLTRIPSFSATRVWRGSTGERTPVVCHQSTSWPSRIPEAKSLRPFRLPCYSHRFPIAFDKAHRRVARTANISFTDKRSPSITSFVA